MRRENSYVGCKGRRGSVQSAIVDEEKTARGLRDEGGRKDVLDGYAEE